MNLFLVIFITIFFILLISKQKTSETFRINHIKLKPENISNKINFIYTTINGIFKIFHGSNITLNNINTKHSKIKELLDIDYVDTGFYNYKHNYLGILYKNNIHKYNLFRQQTESITSIKDFFNNIDTSFTIKCLFYLHNKIYIFSDNNIIIYDLDENKIIIQSECNTIFEKIPNKIECCFLNYNELEQYYPLPYIYVLKNKIYYKYKFISYNNFKLIETNKFTFKNNNKLIKNDTLFKIEKDGLYRLISIGGGNISGGNGGVVFNDLKLKKKDPVIINIGKSGIRLSVKDKNVSKYNLPYTGSCSGAGGTSIYIKNKLIMVSGGGGGWSSEIIDSPSICHSVNYFDTKEYKSRLFFPIKKIIIMTLKNKESGNKLIINTLDVKVKNVDEIKMNIAENPKINDSQLKKNEYETSMSKIGENASIEIHFNKVLTDYTIELDYKIKNSKMSSLGESNVVLFDEQNRKYVINNFNKFFGKTITNKKIFDYFSYKNNPKIKSNNQFVNNGNIIKNNYIKSNNIFYLDGGEGGKFNGGFATSNKFNKINSCGGGGGYLGGKGISLIDNLNNTKIPLDYMAATGGKSFVKDLSIKTNNLLYDQFINNFNDKDGYVIMNKIK
jgi:hypothetical protein